MDQALVPTTTHARSKMPQSQPPTSAEWEQHRSLITELYVGRKWTQKDVAQYMRTEHGFRASEKMFISRFLKWAINKKMRQQDAIAIMQAVSRRAQAGRKAHRIRLRGRNVTEQEARESLRRRKRGISDSVLLQYGPATPSDISIDSESEDDRSENAVLAHDDASRILCDAFVKQRPDNPGLVGDERFNAFFMHKMRDWRAGGCTPAPDVQKGFSQYVDDLSSLLRSNNDMTSVRFIWTVAQLESAAKCAFEMNGTWLMAGLARMATEFPYSSPRNARYVRYIRATCVRVARSTAGEAHEHPLFILCCNLFDSELAPTLQRLLRLCSVFGKETFGEYSWQHWFFERSRSRFLEHCGDLREAESILVNLTESLSSGTLEQQATVLYAECDLAAFYYRQGTFERAHGVSLESIEHIDRVSRERDLPVHSLEKSYRTAYDYALNIRTRLMWDQGDFVGAEYYAREEVAYCEGAFGTSNSRTVHALDGLFRCLEAREKWDELERLKREWKDVINPPGFFEVDPEIAAAMESGEGDDERQM